MHICAGPRRRRRQGAAEGRRGGGAGRPPPPAGKHQLSLHCLSLTALCLTTCWLLCALESASTKTKTHSRAFRGGCTPAGMPYTLLQHCTYAAVSARAELLLLLQPVTHTTPGQEQAGWQADKTRPHCCCKACPMLTEGSRLQPHSRRGTTTPLPVARPRNTSQPRQPPADTSTGSAGLDHCPHLLLL